MAVSSPPKNYKQQTMKKKEPKVVHMISQQNYNLSEKQISALPHMKSFSLLSRTR
jgi:hypothetical protein